ncbi:hypothetical protein [Alsobacter sp. R-9]
MRLALSLIVLLATAGILLRAWFSPIRPFNIVSVSVRQATVFIRQQWAVALFLMLPTFATPFGGIVASLSTTSTPLRFLIALLWQFVCAAGMALVAIRIHRGLVKRERGNRILLGRREARMIGFVLTALALIVAIRLVPFLADGIVGGLPLRLIELGSNLAAWVVTISLCYVGPAASLDDKAPVAASLFSFRTEVFATAALVIVLQGINSTAFFAIGALLSLSGINVLILTIASLIITLLLWMTFIISENALVIALTRIRENVYESDTRGRDYNADWF